MADKELQNFKNHLRMPPLAWRFTFAIVVANTLWSLYRVIVAFSLDALMAFFVAVGLFLIFFYVRIFTLTVQDRIIRLEMRLRLAKLLPPDLQNKIDHFTVNQLIGLRFASDTELPELARTVLSDNIQSRKTIKEMVVDWQADWLRV